jgi:hypothetical protein
MRRLISVAAAVSFASTAAAQPAAVVSLQVVGPALVATGVTPGGTVVWYSVSREVVDYAERIVPHSELGTADPAGTAKLTLAQPVAARAIFVAVDLKSGLNAVATPPGVSLNELPGGAFTLLTGGSGGAGEVQDSGGTVEALWVRPGVGAWTLGLAGDSPLNLAGAGRAVRFALGQMRPLAGGPAAPNQIANGDLILLIHPHKMELERATIGAKP